MADIFVELVKGFGFPMLGVLFALNGALIGKFIPTDFLLVVAMILFATASRAFLLILLIGSISTTIGQVALFWFVRQEQDSAMDKIHWLSHISRDKLEKAEDTFDSGGEYAIIVSNMIPGIKGFLTIPAALDEDMGYPVFTLCSFAGTFFFQLVLVMIAIGLSNMIF